MRAYPKPFDASVPADRQRAIITPDACRPKLPDLFEMQRGMPWISQPQLEIFPRQRTDLRRQIGQRLTKACGRRGLHRAAPSTTRLLRRPDAHKERPIARFLHPPRSVDPTPLRRAPSDAPTRLETPSLAASRSPLRFPPVCSQAGSKLCAPEKASGQPFIQ